MIGLDVAAPTLFEAFARLGGAPVPLPLPPASVLTLAAAELPPHLRRVQLRGTPLVDPGPRSPSRPTAPGWTWASPPVIRCRW